MATVSYICDPPSSPSGLQGYSPFLVSTPHIGPRQVTVLNVAYFHLQLARNRLFLPDSLAKVLQRFTLIGLPQFTGPLDQSLQPEVLSGPVDSNLLYQMELASC